MPTPDLVAAPARLAPCIILIGMAGAGKSTVGGVLARELGWAFLDSDHLIEALYGARLQDVTDALGKEAFLDAECTVIRAIKANRTVIGTGGSVVYREEAMRHLAKLGPIVHLDLPLAVIEERIARNPQRGLAIAPGQTLPTSFVSGRPCMRPGPICAATPKAKIRVNAPNGYSGICRRSCSVPMPETCRFHGTVAIF